MAMVVRSIFGREKSGFVDFRSPANFLGDYCVIDFDGLIYPSDEARMLSRIHHIDLSLGSLETGIDEVKTDELNRMALNQTHEDCLHCVYMPYCGTDIIDDLSRYDRVDVIKQESWFCRRQMFVFDFIFSKIVSQDREWLDVFLCWIDRTSSPTQAYELFQ